MTVDLSTVWQLALACASAAAAGALPVLTRALMKHLRLAAGSAAADDLDQALQHGAALALDAVKSLSAHNATLTVPAGPLAGAAALVSKLAPAAIAELGVTPAEIESLIAAKLGAALGADMAPAVGK